MISAPAAKVAPPAADCKPATRPHGLAEGFRWRVRDDPPPRPEPTRYQKFYFFLYEFNRY